MRIVEEVLGGLLRRLADFGEKAEPQDLHLLLSEVLRLELGEFHEDEVQPLKHLLRMEIVNHAVVVVVLPDVRLEGLVDEVQRIDGLKEMVFLTSGQLSDIRLRGVEEDALLEGRRPVHLHLDDELATARLLAPDVDGGVLAGRRARHEFRRQILD